MTKNTEKVLLQDNASQAANFIDSLEKTYIPAIRTLIIGLKNLGFAEPNKELLCQVLSENYTDLDAMYQDIIKTDIDRLATPAAKNKAQEDATGFLHDFLQESKTVFAQVIVFKGRSLILSDPEFQQYWILDESGDPIIASEVKTQIYEAFRIYAEDPLQIKVLQLQERTAQSLTDLLKAMKKAGFLNDYFPSTPWLALSQIFDVSIKADCFVIEPKILCPPDTDEVSEEYSTEPMVVIPREAKDVSISKRNIEKKDILINKR